MSGTRHLASAPLTFLFGSRKALNTKEERNLYEPFVKLANSALVKLRGLTIDGLRPSEEDIIFHVSDDRTITGRHKAANTMRKPDVVILSWNDARKSMPEGHRDVLWDHIAEYVAWQKPHHPFKWPWIYVPLEFKPLKKGEELTPEPTKKDDGEEDEEEEFADVPVRRIPGDATMDVETEEAVRGSPSKSKAVPRSQRSGPVSRTARYSDAPGTFVSHAITPLALSC